MEMVMLNSTSKIVFAVFFCALHVALFVMSFGSGMAGMPGYWITEQTDNIILDFVGVFVLILLVMGTYGIILFCSALCLHVATKYFKSLWSGSVVDLRQIIADFETDPF